MVQTQKNTSDKIIIINNVCMQLKFYGVILVSIFILFSSFIFILFSIFILFTIFLFTIFLFTIFLY